jgi:Fe-S-cluster containining protein
MTSNAIPLREPGDPDTSAPIECFQCGVCCIKWQPLLSPAELREMAADLGLTLRTFSRRYTRPYPLRRGWRQLVTGETGGCVFLKADAGRYLCSVYDLRPQVCRDWKAGLDKKECLEGMRAQ